MRSFLSLFIILVLISFVTPIAFAKKHHSQRSSQPAEKTSNAPVIGAENLSVELNRIINSMGSNLNVGIQIKSMKDGATLYAKNEHRLFIPASILKIFYC